ncbi:hypothetical protein [Paludibacterium paludis]|uniref:N-acetyltransferase domain-containing protein n=1 Tax=Paludibacterium paludis TaxID=1225769 RepID=A0A918P0F1_9NEIS|nr:hypothetical protein [Paludibacterium paludis]GGY10963.1 hypothetical protein GCM10011289_12250 [Paludibacterium paludis]
MHTKHSATCHETTAPFLSGNIEDRAIRPATPDDCPGLVRLFRRTYGDTSHPCLDDGFIRAGIEDGSHRWFVLDTPEGIGACACLARHAWNRSREACFGVVLPELRHLGIVTRLARHCLDCMPQDPAELGYFSMRHPVALHAMRKLIDSVLVGHDGGPNTVDGVREYHMTAVHPPAAGRFIHVTPAQRAMLHWDFLRDAVYAPLGLAIRPGPYPEDCLVGTEHEQETDGFRYTFDARIGALTLGGYTGAAPKENGLADDLERFLATHGKADYVCARILADKHQLTRRMLAMGFAITAYLPAWYWREGARFDALMLVRRRFDDSPQANGFEEEIATMDQAFAQLAARLV